MDFYLWARKWNISEQAIDDLKKLLGFYDIKLETNTVCTSEKHIMDAVRIEATQKGARLWRNNVGATYTHDGSFLRFGLANDSSAVNSKIKSADLIGIRPVEIKPEHVGCIFGQFISREIKKSTWKYSGTEREEAQLRWAMLILLLGGNAAFASGPNTI